MANFDKTSFKINEEWGLWYEQSYQKEKQQFYKSQSSLSFQKLFHAVSENLILGMTPKDFFAVQNPFKGNRKSVFWLQSDFEIIEFSPKEKVWLPHSFR